jgi:primosomal protein N' (replication factor Y)
VILHVAMPVPLRRHFDYLPVGDAGNLRPGVRLHVPFGKGRHKTGMLLGASASTDVPAGKLKRIGKVLDETPLLNDQDLALLTWASRYYHYPLGEVVFQALPALLRQGRAAVGKTETVWLPTATGLASDHGELQRAPRQREILDLLRRHPQGLNAEALAGHCSHWQAPLKALLEKGLVSRREAEAATTPDTGELPPAIVLNAEQQAAVDAVAENMQTPQRFLLEGITGSGKTEVYIELIRRVMAGGRQALVLVPEIGLTPQFINRLRRSVQAHMVVLHSGLSPGQRLQGWLDARDGRAAVILGTRSAVWTPLLRPGLIIVDEEHDPSYKQQDTFRYSARDVAIMRASLAGVPVVLGSATPSMESLNNAAAGRYTRLSLTRRAGGAQPPVTRIIDLRNRTMTGALSDSLINAIGEELAGGRQAMLFLNRRGFAPVIMCHHCGWTATCPRCNIPMTYHKQHDRLLCHHCGSQSGIAAVCGACSMSELVQVGFGTERLTETLTEVFPSARILRIDRDSTRRKGAMEQMVEEIHAGDADILVGTQMLAKGHHFPDLTLVGIVDADSGLFSADFRASERMAQQIMQVSGRAGRASARGTVLIQTHYPDHPLLQTLVKGDYGAFARVLLEERKITNLPPYSHLALLSAEGYDEKEPVAFLQQARARLPAESLDLLGPVPAPMEKRAGRFRFQLLIQSNDRATLHNALQPWSMELEGMDSGRRVRWSLDIDPQDLL